MVPGSLTAAAGRCGAAMRRRPLFEGGGGGSLALLAAADAGYEFVPAVGQQRSQLDGLRVALQAHLAAPPPASSCI